MSPDSMPDAASLDKQAEGHDVMGDELVEFEQERSRKQRLRKPLLILAPIILIAGALFFYLHGGRYEETDNAYVQSGMVSVSSNVAGRVVAIAVTPNQQVKKGDILFRLDPAPYQARVDQATAALAAARTDVQALRANYRQGQSQLAAERDQLDYARAELARQKELLAEGISSQAQYDKAALALKQASQQLQTQGQQNAGIEANLAGEVNGPIEEQPAVRRAQAALDAAKLDLGYTVIRASQDGTVAKVNQLQVGDYIQAAQPVFSIVGTHLWIEANFKEDQLTHMRKGQPATVEIDAFPDLELHGHIASFTPGTGNSFSVLPAENATGNWVKVVQRLPVEIEVENMPKNVPIQPGLSANATVDTGYQRHLFGPGTTVDTREARAAH